ncbi:MAG: beta-xylosidase [Fibrobacteres bacterium]|nr:beta-xylosidase [Fibrobacterota bacterium]
MRQVPSAFRFKALLRLWAALLPLFPGPVRAQTVTITVDATAAGAPLKEVWSWHGYDEANYTTTQPGLDLLDSVVANSVDPVYIRTHFLLNTGDGSSAQLKWGSTNVYTEANGQPVYDWKLMDGIMDAITGHKAFPYAQISFMPQALSSHPTPYQNSSTTATDGGCFYPPTDYDKWAALVKAWVQHSVDRYPNVEKNWVWELWNEPDISYWHGTAAEYQKLFDYTEQAVHTVLPNAVLSGPEMAGAGNIGPFLQHCATGTNSATGKTGTRLDQISFHAKGGTAMVNGHVEMDLGNQLRLHQTGFKTIAGYPQFKDKPIVIGEADPDPCAACPQSQVPADAYRNVAAYGAYEAAMMKHSLQLADSLGVNLRACLAWAWLFNGFPYFQGYRTLSSNGIHKPVLNVFKMLGKLKGDRIPLASTGALGLAEILKNGVRGNPDIDGMAVKNPGKVMALIWNYHDDIVQVAPANVTVKVTLPAGFPDQVRLTHYRMDTTHSNDYTAWLKMGSPQSPTASQLSQLKSAMTLETLAAPALVAAVNGVVTQTFDLPRHGVSLLVLEDPSVAGIGKKGPARNDGQDGAMLLRSHGTERIRITEPGPHVVSLFDTQGRLIAQYRGTGPKTYSLKSLGNARLSFIRVTTARGEKILNDLVH